MWAKPPRSNFAVGHYEMSFGLACDGIDDIAGTKGHVDVGHVVLVEKWLHRARNTYAKNADIGIFPGRDDGGVLSLSGTATGA